MGSGPFSCAERLEQGDGAALKLREAISKKATAAPMSALGHKRTCAAQKGMSALPPKADMCGALVYVRFGPKADIAPVN